MTPQPPDSWAGLGPQGGAGLLRSRQSARGLEVTRAASPGMGGRLSPVSSAPLRRRPPHPHPRVRAATLTEGEQHREAEQGGAAAAPHPRGHGHGGSGGRPRGQPPTTTRPPVWSGSHPTRDCRGAPLSPRRLWGQGVQFRGSLREGGVPGAAGDTLEPVGAGAAPGGRSLRLRAGAPCRLCAAGGEPHVRARPRGRRRLGTAQSRVLGPPAARSSSNPNSREGADLQHQPRCLRAGLDAHTGSAASFLRAPCSSSSVQIPGQVQTGDCFRKERQSGQL